MWYETILKLVLAIVLSGIIGFERENRNRPAGLRTHVLVCVGATVVQITSLEFYNQVLGSYSSDTFRLGAQVISGIGFLGAGTIIKEGNSIKGLTTAASLWAVACIGLTAGTGLYKEAAFSTLAVFVSLKGLRIIERRQLKNRKVLIFEIEVINDSKKIFDILNIMSDYEMEILYLNIGNLNSDTAKIDITTQCKSDYSEIVQKLACVPGIRNTIVERE